MASQGGDLRELLAPPDTARHNEAMNTDPEMITASELAEWVYSREDWRKQRLGLSAPDQVQLDAGKALHGRKESAQRRGGQSLAIGRAMIALAVIVLLVVLLWR